MADIFKHHTIGLSDPGVETHYLPAETLASADEFYDFEQEAGWVPRYIKASDDCVIKCDLSGHDDDHRQKRVILICTKGVNPERVVRIYKNQTTADIDFSACR